MVACKCYGYTNFWKKWLMVLLDLQCTAVIRKLSEGRSKVRKPGDSQRLHVHTQSGYNEGRFSGLLVCPDLGKYFMVQGWRGLLFYHYYKSVYLERLKKEYILYVKLFYCIGTGKEVHVTIGWLEAARCRTRIHVEKAHVCIIQSWGKKCVQG